jgi:hypothetical protein
MAAVNDSQETKPKPAKKRIPKVTREHTDAIVQVINIPLAFLVPDDALNDVEQIALAQALCDAAQQNHVIATIINNLCQAQSNGELALVLGAITAKRLANHGILPEQAGIACEGALHVVASRSTPTTRGANRQRQNHASESTPELAALSGDAGDETGRLELSGLENGQEGERRRRGRPRQQRLSSIP